VEESLPEGGDEGVPGVEFNLRRLWNLFGEVNVLRNVEGTDGLLGAALKSMLGKRLHSLVVVGDGVHLAHGVDGGPNELSELWRVDGSGGNLLPVLLSIGVF